VRRRTRSAFTPAGTVASRLTGLATVSTMTRTTAIGLPPIPRNAERAIAADSMSAASAPVFASRSRSSTLFTR
jgi:hypothetical protein